MIKLRPSEEKELKIFADMESQTHANRFVNSTSFESHKTNFKKSNTIYLSIENSEGKVSGYFILVVETDPESIEFHRVVIDENCRGIGQDSIKEMEKYCRNVLNAKRIWLDVYEDNLIGKHIYEKLGYNRFEESICDGRKLLFYKKFL